MVEEEEEEEIEEDDDDDEEPDKIYSYFPVSSMACHREGHG